MSDSNLGFFLDSDSINLIPGMKRGSVSEKFVSELLKIGSSVTGLKTGFKIPQELGQNPELWEPTLLLSQMKDKKLIEGWRSYFSSSLYPDMPELFISHVKNYQPLVKSKPTTYRNIAHDGVGMNFFSQSAALWSAIGEAVERKSLFFLPTKNNVYASIAELGNSAIDLGTLAGMSPETRSKGYQNMRLTYSKYDQFQWVRGRSLTQKKNIWIPLQLSSLYYRHVNNTEPFLRQLVSTGAAVHTTLEGALVNGVLELIERDAFMITWLNELSPQYVVLEETSSEKIARIVDACKRYNFELHVLRLPTDFKDVEVMVSVLIDRSGQAPAVSVGGNASFSVEDAVIGAIEESMGLHYFMRGRFIHDRINNVFIDFSDKSKIGRTERLLYWCMQENTDRINFLLHGERVNIESLYTPGSFLMRSKKEILESLVHDFNEKQLELSYVDLLSFAEGSKFGLSSILAIAPALQPLYLNENPPHTWGTRLQTVPKKLGFPVRKTVFSEIHPFP